MSAICPNSSRVTKLMTVKLLFKVYTENEQKGRKRANFLFTTRIVFNFII